MKALLGVILALIVGFVPMIIYALILWWFDRYEREPLGLLVAAFLWGAIPAIIFSLIAELMLDVPISWFVNPATATFVGSAVVAPVVEEAFKGTALLLLLLFHYHEIDSVLDGIVYGGLVGFGFAAVENVLYFGSALMETGLSGFLFLALFRAFLFGLNHALFSGFVGLGMALARTAKDWSVKLGAPLIGLLAGITAHTIHNASVTLGAEWGWPCLFTLVSDWGGVLILFAVVIWTGMRERRWIERYLAEEVEQGTLSREDYETVSSHIGRLTTRAEALLSGDLERWWQLGRYYRLATKLAFNKRRLSKFPGDGTTEKQVERLRTQVEEMGGKT